MRSGYNGAAYALSVKQILEAISYMEQEGKK
jgi:hypothetical protein